MKFFKLTLKEDTNGNWVFTHNNFTIEIMLTMRGHWAGKVFDPKFNTLIETFEKHEEPKDALKELVSSTKKFYQDFSKLVS